MTSKISVAIADDHPVTRKGLVSLLNDYPERFEVVGEAKAGYHAVDICIEEKPDVLILDLHMPGDWDGFEVIRRIRDMRLPVKILVLTVEPSGRGMVVDELKADRYLLKDTPNKVILKTIETLAESDTTLHSLKAGPETSTLSGDEARESSPGHKPLSPRELEVLKLAAQGLKKEEIAERLTTTPGTIGVHLSSIYRKLNVKNRAEAVNFAHRNGLLNDD